MGDVDSGEQLGSTMGPTMVVEGLKCPVCWDYFEKPHTLCCGHTFCLRCLQNLARITRSSKTRTPLDRLRMCCPACRKRTPVRPILKRRVALNYALKQFMNDWFDSPLSQGQIYSITLRSVGCQTETGQNEILDSLMLDDSSKLSDSQQDDISKSDEHEVVVYRFDKCKSADIIKLSSTDVNTEIVLTEEADDNIGVSDDNHASSSSEEESEQDMQIGPMFARIVNDEDEEERQHRRIGLLGLNSVSSVLALLFLELSVVYRGIRQSRSRTILTLFWFFYGGIIVYMSRAFLPWMTFYTAIYFIIIYVEVSPRHQFR